MLGFPSRCIPWNVEILYPHKLTLKYLSTLKLFQQWPFQSMYSWVLDGEVSDSSVQEIQNQALSLSHFPLQQFPQPHNLTTAATEVAQELDMV